MPPNSGASHKRGGKKVGAGKNRRVKCEILNTRKKEGFLDMKTVRGNLRFDSHLCTLSTMKMASVGTTVTF